MAVRSVRSPLFCTLQHTTHEGLIEKQLTCCKRAKPSKNVQAWLQAKLTYMHHVGKLMVQCDTTLQETQQNERTTVTQPLATFT